MQKISRIYLANCGFDTAWYDGITLDLREPLFNAPTDTIINLENGGGKTSLLSLVLSCFETNKDRFLKTLNDKNHRFGDYFATDGTLGLIIVEWLMPPRKAGEGSYRLITGQAVAMRPNADPPDERMFFSFEEDDHLSLEEVPGPKLCDVPILSMTEFSSWLHDKQRLSPGNLFITRKQSDWHRHLEASLIDLDMLRMQVDFSATEGGFDKGFLGFQSEDQFLRRFFYLTMDAGRAASVRDAVATACDKLRRKPDFVRRLTQLQAFQTTLQTFSTAAAELRQEQVQQLSLVWKGTRLAKALTEEASRAQTTVLTEGQFAETQRGVLNLQTDLSAAKATEHAVLTDWQFQRKTTAAAAALTTARRDKEQAEKDVLHLKAARLQRSIRAAQHEIKELEKQAQLQTTELAPFLTRVKEAGALLRRALFDQATSLRGQAKELSDQTEARKKKADTLRTEMSGRATRIKQLSSEKTRLDEQQAQMTAAVARLATVGALLTEDEPVADALARWQDALQQVQAELGAVTEQQAALVEDANKWRSASEVATARAGALALPIGQEKSFLDDGQRAKERLSKSPTLTAAAEAERVDDLEAASLREQVDQLITSYGQQVSSADVRLAQLTADKQAIEDTGVAGHSADVERVVQHLRLEGAKSARAFNQYLAQAVPDAERSRHLVQSNPARFLGVCVADSDWERVSKVQWGAHLPDKPVVVSVTTLTADAAMSGIVVPASSDAAYNKDAAFELKLRLDSTLNKEHETRKNLAARRDQAVLARKELQEYQDRFGNGKLDSAQTTLARLEAERDEAQREAAAAAAKEQAATREAKALDQRIAGYVKLITAGTAQAKALRDFQDQHEARRSAREARLPELIEELAVAEAQQEEAGTTLDDYQRQDLAAATAQSRFDADAGVLDAERAKLEHYEASFDAQGWLQANDWTLENLRQSYDGAASLYRTNAEQRLGVLQTQLNAANTTLTNQKTEYSRDFPGVSGDDLAPYQQTDVERALPAAQSRVMELVAKVETAVTAEGGAKGAHAQWKAAHKAKLPARTPDMEALDGEALSEAIRAADAARLFAAEAAIRADNAVKQAAQNMLSAKAQAKAATERTTMLMSALGLDDLEGLERLEAHLVALGHDVAVLRVTFLVEADTQSQVQALVKDFTTRRKESERSDKRARQAFEALRTAALSHEFVQVEPELSAQMLANDFDSAVADALRLTEGMAERIAVTQSSLDGMAQDFDAAADELFSLTQVAQTTLNSAMRKTIPSAAPYVGGKHVLKMKSHLASISAEDRRRVLRYYLDGLIESNRIPATGTDLAADALEKIGGGNLGINLLKMSVDDSRQYEPVAEMKLSGGEGVTTAMFLYCVVSQVRADTQAKEQRLGGGPLLLDNPFAKATKPVLWEAQLMLANAIGVQFIFATAIHDYSTLGQFKHFVRLRRGSVNTKTRRMHLELANYHLNDLVAEAA